MFLTFLIPCIIQYQLRGCWILDGHGSLTHFFTETKPNQTPPNFFFEKMQSSAASNNRFATLSTIKTPSGKIVLPHVASSGEELPAATGSNAIPIRGNKKSFGKKLMPVNRAQSAHPGPLASRPAPKLSPQVKSYVVPSKRAIALKRAISTPLPQVAKSGPSNWRDQFPPLVPHQFLWSLLDQKMNSGSSKSFSHVASRGIKTGSKQTFRSKESLLPSWSETWTMPEDWFPVPANEKNILLGKRLRRNDS